MRVTCLSGVASLALAAASLIGAAPASADTLREALVQAYNGNPTRTFPFIRVARCVTPSGRRGIESTPAALICVALKRNCSLTWSRPIWT